MRGCMGVALALPDTGRRKVRERGSRERQAGDVPRVKKKSALFTV